MRRQTSSKDLALFALVVRCNVRNSVGSTADGRVVTFDSGCDDLYIDIVQLADVDSVKVAITTQRLIDGRCQRTPGNMLSLDWREKPVLLVLTLIILLVCVQIAIELQNVKLEGIDKDDPMFGDWARVSEDEWTDFRKQ